MSRIVARAEEDKVTEALTVDTLRLIESVTKNMGDNREITVEQCDRDYRISVRVKA